jgi:hypothetical protein
VSHREWFGSVINFNLLMLHREIMVVYCEDHTEHTSIGCVQNAGILALDVMAHTVTGGLKKSNCFIATGHYSLW